MTTYSAFQEVENGLLYLDILHESLPTWVKSLQDESLETIKWDEGHCFWVAKPSELQVGLLAAGSLN